MAPPVLCFCFRLVLIHIAFQPLLAGNEYLTGFAALKLSLIHIWLIQSKPTGADAFGRR